MVFWRRFEWFGGSRGQWWEDFQDGGRKRAWSRAFVEEVFSDVCMVCVVRWKIGLVLVGLVGELVERIFNVYLVTFCVFVFLVK